MDLGGATSTEWEAGDLAKILRTTYSTHPKLKKCFLGLIHSHHNMGAFFSGTDADTLRDMAPEIGFYCSLVVATEKAPFAFAISYKDQYGQSQLIELDEDDIVGPPVVANNEWIEIADSIEKAAKPKSKWGKGSKQQSLLGNNYLGTVDKATKTVDYTKVQAETMELLAEKLVNGAVTWWDFQSQCKVLGTDSNEYWADRPEFSDTNGYGHYRY